jgi:hypothetical protein
MVGAYRLVERIGEGGMGVVHLALDPAGRKVAIKVLRPAVAGDTTALRRLAREVDTMRRVHSPHVAEVIDADVTAERPYVVTQFVPGRTLERVVQEDGPLRGRALERLAGGLASALAAIHAADVVHRDLKPGNVMLVDDEPIVIDFGIAHAVDLTRLTATGLVIGTPGYLAPEIVEGEEAGPASDVHSWASTVAFGATGRAPFGTGPFETIFFRIMQGKADVEGVPGALLPLLRSALSLNPAERPTAARLVELAGRIDVDAPMATKAQLAVPGHTRVFGPADAPSGFAPAAGTAPVPTAPPPPPAAPARPTRPARPEDFKGLLPPVAPPASPVRPPQPPQDPTRGARPAPPTYPGYDPRDRHSPYGPDQRGYPGAAAAKPYGWYRILGALLLAGMVGLAAMLPAFTFIILVLALLVLRTGDRLAKGLSERRAHRGPSATDVPSMIIKTPVAAVRALLVTVLVTPLGALVGFVVGVVYMLTPPEPPASQVGTVAMGTFVVVACLGPGGKAPRRQLARVWSAVLRRRQQAMVAVGVIALVVLFMLSFAFTVFPDWGPLSDNPFKWLVAVRDGRQDFGIMDGLRRFLEGFSFDIR